LFLKAVAIRSAGRAKQAHLREEAEDKAGLRLPVSAPKEIDQFVVVSIPQNERTAGKAFAFATCLASRLDGAYKRSLPRGRPQQSRDYVRKWAQF